VALGLTLALIVALLAFFARAASAQDFDVPQDSTIRLTLGDDAAGDPVESEGRQCARA
jgi:hypothetical protein